MKRLPPIPLLMLLSACAHGPKDPVFKNPISPVCEAPPGGGELNVVTFNAAIAPGMNSWSTPRLPHVTEALASLDYDVLCLQEVWPYQAAEAVAAALGKPTSHMVYADTRGMHQTGDDSCSPSAVRGLAECARRECGGVADEDMAICAVDKCTGTLTTLYLFDRGCFNCMAASVGKSIDETVAMCTAPGGASRLYGGTNGIMLVSRWPVEAPAALDLPSSGANRVALFARVRPPGREPIEVACTHISSPQRVSPTYPGFHDWESEQSEQIRLISGLLAERGGDRPQLLVGDLNVSRNWLEGGSGQSRSVFWLTQRLGFISPGVYVKPDLCSACRGNSFRGDSSKSHLIDHVMVRDPEGGATVEPVCAEKLFTEQVDVSAYGQTRRMHISDHYGIRVKLRIQ
jgi:endonuclease/exonuclease/phosphatase family metal-dependent hydrolase